MRAVKVWLDATAAPSQRCDGAAAALLAAAVSPSMLSARAISSDADSSTILVNPSSGIAEPR
jgi:hypothetical protein